MKRKMMRPRYLRSIMLGLVLLSGQVANVIAAEAIPYTTPRVSESWIPYTSSGYVGVNLGVPKFHTECYRLFSCDNPQVSGKIYTGGLFARAIGMELGYINVGHAPRNGGHISAQGINLSLVGNLPLGDTFNLFAKVGGTYGWTRTSASPLLISYPTGRKDGLGLSYGAGFAISTSTKTQILAEWERHDFNFRPGISAVEVYSIGFKYLF